MRRRWILLTLALGAFLWTALRNWGYQVDDTFIALRFARSLVEGHGLVFNPGERVEGYTSLGFVLTAALFLRLGLDPVSALTALSAVAAATTLWLAARLERTIVGPETASGSFCLSVPILLASSAFVFWSLRAMETLPFGALLLGAVSLSLHEARTGRVSGSGVLFGLLALTRPEGPFLFGVWLLALVVAERRTRGDWSALRRHAANALLVSAVVTAQLAWRWHYYGDLLPNTFYAKVTGGPGQLATGLRYLRDWCLELPLLAASLAFPLVLLALPVRSRMREPAFALALYATLLAYVLYVVAVGADFMPYFRFFVAVLPVCAVLVAATLRCSPRLSSVSVAIALLAIQLGAGSFSEQPYRAFVAERTTDVGARVGAWLAERLAPDDWIAVNTSGSLPYVSRLPTIDMLGLTDAQIAKRPVYIVSEGWSGHRRGWGEYVLRRRPKLVLWYNSAGLAEPHYLGDHELAEDPRFRFFYSMRLATLPTAPGSEPLRRFLGFPFGFAAAGVSAIPDLGLRLSFHERPFGWTSFHEGPLRVVYFERDARDDELFEAGLPLRGDPRALVALAATRWAAATPRPGDAVARAEVEALCGDALRAIEAGDRERARQILADAAQRNAAARSPRVPQYVANLAVLTGELFPALSAQKEALRLDPRNALYRENLIDLLSVPWERFRKRAVAERD